LTAARFRQLALAHPGAVEGKHMGHADFRVGGKIFATLGYPEEHSAVVMLTPQDQGLIVRDHPNTFSPVANKWGASGSTVVDLAGADMSIVAIAIEAAWRKRAPKADHRG
jgi:hypothetical protein